MSGQTPSELDFRHKYAKIALQSPSQPTMQVAHYQISVSVLITSK